MSDLELISKIRESEASQYEINQKINEMAKEGWELVDQQVYDEWHILLTFKRYIK